MNERQKRLENLDDEIVALLSACGEELLGDPDPATLASGPMSPALEQKLSRARAIIRDLASLGAASRKETPSVSEDRTSRDPAPVTSDEIPKRIGRFEIRRILGHGGFGIVYLAHDPNLRRDVALKIPVSGSLATREMRERFLREARAAAGLDHANIVPVFEADNDGSVCYITSAYCRGTDLSQWLEKRRDPAPARFSANLVARLAEAIAHAHRRGVLHRDLKPSNVLLEPLEDREAPTADQGAELDFTPKVADFGLAKLQQGYC